VRTGEATFLSPGPEKLEHVLKASSAIPLFYRRTLHVDGIPYVDGGVADPIPVIKAHEMGADRIVVLRSRPEGYRMKEKRFPFFYRYLLREQPAVAGATLDRARAYNEAIDFMEDPPEGVEVIALHPSEDLGLKRFSKEIDVLEAAYNAGLLDGRILADRLEEGR
jgi:predicted patatin/cPLA2 family phospholipase